MKPSVRKATPDSEAMGSSEDERPWPSAPQFGTLPRKENGVPGLGGGIWSQKRGSFKMEKAAQRNAAREAYLAAPSQPRSGLRAEGTPSPAASEGSGALPFAIPLQPTPKVGRSASHSQGQREFPPASGTHPGSNDHAPVLPLGLLTEEVDTETDSELGGALTHTTSHPPIGLLHRTSTLPASYDTYNGKRGSDELGDASGGAPQGFRVDHRFEGAFSNIPLEHQNHRSQWQSHLGWDDLPNVNESRRHSLADIPTRRGSQAGTADNRAPAGSSGFWPQNDIYDWDNGPHTSQEQILRNKESDTMKYHDRDEYGRKIHIPNMYKVPFIELDENERSEQAQRRQINPSIMVPFGGGNRPRKLLYVVSFKCSRVEVFYLLENTGLRITEGDIVIVEADRGQDLGTVQHANVTPDEARHYKRKYCEEQYKWLMMFSKANQPGSVNPNAAIGGDAGPSNLLANAPATMQGLPRDGFTNTLKPKAIKRLASAHEIRMLADKETNEAKAKRTCQQKVLHLHLDMEILDAEWQWDFQKIIFYYYADHYINFKDLITDLYRLYKSRIWMSAINPASFSQHALGQPPSGIGPGAIGQFNPQYNNNAYSMMYGPDPDPYGAIPPYQIGYDTYTPNYPSIPGVANSFAPMAYSSGNDDPAPTVAPGVTPTGTAADYNYYYERDDADSVFGPHPYGPGPSYQQQTVPPMGRFHFPQSSAYQPPTSNLPTYGSTTYGATNTLQASAGGSGGLGALQQGKTPSPSVQDTSNISGAFNRLSLAPIGTLPPSQGAKTQTTASHASRTQPLNTTTTTTGFENPFAVSSGLQPMPMPAPAPPIPGLSVPGFAGPLDWGNYMPRNQRAQQTNPQKTQQQPPQHTSQHSAQHTPQHTPQLNPTASRFGDTGAEDDGRAHVMRNYLAGLKQPDAKDKHADEMSRER